MKADDEEAAEASPPNDATHEDVPADAETSAASAAATSSETKHHAVVTEVPKFRFVSIAKKSAGYKSEYAGSYIEGKSAQEILAARQKELGLLRKSSTGSVKSKTAAAEEVAAKNLPSELNTEERSGDDTGGLKTVGKLNIEENKDEYSEEFIADVDGGRRVGKEGDLDGDGDAEKEESDKKDGLDIYLQEKSEAYESESDEEDDLEAQTAAVQLATTATLSLPISGDEKQNVVVNVSLSLATTSAGEAVGAVPVTSPTNGADTPTNKQEDTEPTKKCSTKKMILIALIVLLVVAVAVLGVALGTRSTGDNSESKDDANSSLNNNQDVANDADANNDVTDPTPFPTDNDASESLAKVSSLSSSMFFFLTKCQHLLLTTIKLNSGMLQLNLPSTLLLFSMCQLQHQYQQLPNVVTGFYQTKGWHPATKTWKLNNKCLYLVEVQM